MRIPPLYRKRSFKIFFVGMAFGGILSWAIFLFIYGTWHERFSVEIKTQHEEIIQLQQEKKIWQDEFSKLNEMNKKNLTIQSVIVKIENASKFKLDSFTVFEMEDEIKTDLNSIVGKDIESIHKNRRLLKNAIENKIITVNDKRFKLDIRELYVYTEVEIYLNLKLE